MLPEIKVYRGKFGDEAYLCDMESGDYLPRKNELIFYQGVTYKVLYTMHDLDDNIINVFVRMAVEEDY